MGDERSGSAKPTNHAMELIQIESRRVERRERLMRRGICHTQTLAVDGGEKGEYSRSESSRAPAFPLRLTNEKCVRVAADCR